MFTPGIWQLVVVLLIVLVLFGSRLPMLARSFGQSINEFKKGVKEIDEKTEE
ncbi:twin arginine translocase protein A [Pseudobythopirellula maris]|uniref:Sec-independent protein translocase protein TatA n=1 Tax=Pseudobythopirellula maris TaxID=2527991 RepID=A0A5C5ZHE2_9BACT|nr:twin-arginine translocase TatA/TatE family subunit [Pseudobythopirellula maris]TWT86626.1 twin arginine translocase protein A [Pseudobythopirellula maris]